MRPYNVSYYGDVNHFHIRELILSLTIQKETGALLVRRERVLKKLYFSKGKIYWLQSNQARDGLLRHLIEENAVNLAILAEWLQALQQGAGGWSQFIDFIAAKTRLTKERILELQQQWLKVGLAGLVNWYRGQYLFLFDEQPTGEISNHEALAPEKPLVESLRRRFSKEFLRRHFANVMDTVPILFETPEKMIAHLQLHGPEAQLVQKLPSEKTLKQLLLGCPMQSAESQNLILILETLGFISFRKPREPEKNGSAAPKDLGVEGMSLLQRLKTHGPSVLAKSPFEMLDIPRVFEEEDLRRGYYTIAQNFHHKEYVDVLPRELRDLSYQIFDKASNIFEALVVWEKKRKADNFTAFHQLEAEFSDVLDVRTVESELAYLRGVDACRTGDNEGGLSFFENAVRLSPNQNQYRSWLAWTRYRTATGAETVRFLSDLRRCTEDDPLDLDAKTLYAKALEAEGKTSDAYREYREALNLSPNSPELLAGERRTFPLVSSTELETLESDQVDAREEESRLNELLTQMEKGTYYEILGVERETPIPEVRAAYFELAKKYHPDRYKNSRLLGAAQDIFILINEAYDVLTSEEKRKNYEARLRALKDQKIRVEHERHRNEEHFLRKGQSQIQANNWDAACEHFSKEAARLGYEDNPLYQALFAWALFNRDFQKDEQVLATVEARLQKIVEGNPELVEAYVVWGKIYRRMNRNHKAKKYFELALSYDDNHIEALRELRLINQRIGSEEKSVAPEKPREAEEKPGRFGSFFSRRKH